MKLGKIEAILVTSMFALIMVLIFNNPLNNLIGINTETEISIMMKISAFAVVLAIIILSPIGTGADNKTTD